MLIENFKLDLDSDHVPWQPTGVPGIQLLPLDPAVIVRGEDAPRDTTVLIRMEPGHGYPAHRHIGLEQVLILQGGYSDERGEHGVGSYLRYEPGSAHTPVALGNREQPASPDNQPCVLFAVSKGGIERP